MKNNKATRHSDDDSDIGKYDNYEYDLPNKGAKFINAVDIDSQ